MSKSESPAEVPGEGTPSKNPQPFTAAARADQLVAAFNEKHRLDSEASATLHSLVAAAIEERHEEVVDTRIGRVMAATIAQL